MGRGALVVFDWWSSYSAMSISIDSNTGKNVWVELLPGDMGLVIDSHEDEVFVYMSNEGHVVKIHTSMLTLVG